MSDPVNTALLILRVATGVVFLAHGIKHARGRQKTSNWFGSIGFQSPQLQWFLSTAMEITAGAMLILGLLTSLGAATVVGIMAVAFWTVHKAAGFFVTARPDEGWEYVFILTVIAFALAIAGPGEFSLDEELGIARQLDGWVGLALAAGGIATAVGELVTFYRPARVGVEAE